MLTNKQLSLSGNKQQAILQLFVLSSEPDQLQLMSCLLLIAGRGKVSILMYIAIIFVLK